ncbi:MAG: DUF4097 family beta strand repeat-containing protein [Povalibacter sp.]
MSRNSVHAACAVGFFMWTGALFAQSSAENITVPLSRPAEPMTLNIDLMSAQIEVIGEDRKDAQLSVTMLSGGRKIKTPSGTKALTGGSGALEVEERDNVISVESEMPMGKVAIVARVPRRSNLTLSTVQDGEITVRDVTGTLQLENVNGPITALSINGAVIAESVNGAINVGFATINASEATALSSISGDIKLTLPAKAAVELRLDSAQGQIESDFELDVKPSKPSVVRNEGRNGVSVRVEDVIVAAVNGGGPVIKLKTLNGTIRIANSAK